jgi:glycerol-3-phosphate O-acyltransferase / dihydroxyacetone phosphate acyltransferase
LYALLVTLTGLAVDLFYRRRNLGGAVPREGPVLLVANHPNGLIDPVVLARLAGRRVRTLAKEPLFRMPVLGWLVRGIGALPVYRTKDGADTAKNDATFQAVYAALANGDCVALFPEGISHHLPSLQPLKTGAARMALGAERERGPGLGVQLVPVGLVYDDKGRFGSALATQVGAPLRVADFSGSDERGAVRALTDAVGESIRALTLELERWEDKPLLELAERIWPDDEAQDSLPRVRALAAGAHALKQRDSARYEELRERVARFSRWLHDTGLSPTHLRARFSALNVARFLARKLVALTLGLALALVGTTAYLVPFLLVDLLARLGEGHAIDVVATKKVLASLLVYPPWQLALSAALVIALGPLPGLLTSLALPLLGLYAVHFVGSQRRALEDARAFLLLQRSGLRARLEEERAALRDEFAAVAALLDEPA